MSSSYPQRALSLRTIWNVETERTIEESSPVTDEEALHRLKTQDKDALALLFDRYSRLILTIGFRILRERGEAEEVMQSVFLYLYQKAELFDAGKGTAKSWIVQVAYHRALDRRAYLAHRQFYLGTDLMVVPDTLSGSTDIEHEIGLRLNREHVLKALEELPEKQRRTLELFFFEGLDWREIGERLGDSVANVRHHYYRGLGKLRNSALVQRLRGKNL